MRGYQFLRKLFYCVRGQEKQLPVIRLSTAVPSSRPSAVANFNEFFIDIIDFRLVARNFLRRIITRSIKIHF